MTIVQKAHRKAVHLTAKARAVLIDLVLAGLLLIQEPMVVGG
jgi:hypothetical protein